MFNIDKRFMITPIAVELIHSGFTGNGCGTGGLVSIVASSLQWIVGVDFSQACLVHDAEVSRADILKSEKHRLDSDANFEYNCIACMNGEFTVWRFRLAIWFHTAVTVNSRNVYYVQHK